MTGATLAGSWKNNFRFQLNFTRQSMLSDALPPVDLECPSCTNSSLGLRCAEYLREGAQNTVVWKVEAKKRGSERPNDRAESRTAHLLRKSALKKDKLTL